MILKPLQLDILTIEQQHRRNIKQQEKSAFPAQDQATGTEITAEQKEQENASLSVSKGLQLQKI